MAQAVIPAVLQDLITEHNLFQRPEWQRLTQLDKDMIKTLCRTDLSDGQRARQYNALAKSYIKNRLNVLINGTQFQNKQQQPVVKTQIQTTDEDKAVTSRKDTPEPIETNSSFRSDDVVNDDLEDDSILPEYTNQESSIDMTDETTSKTINSDDEIDYFSDAGELFSSGQKQPNILKRTTSASNIYNKVIQILTTEFQGKVLTPKEAEDFFIRKQMVNDFVNVLKSDNLMDKSALFNIANAKDIQKALMTRDPEYYRELQVSHPILQQLSRNAEASEIDSLSPMNQDNVTSFDYDGLDRFLVAEKVANLNQSGRRSGRLAVADRVNIPFAVPMTGNVNNDTVDEIVSKKRTRPEDDEDDSEDYSPTKLQTQKRKSNQSKVVTPPKNKHFGLSIPNITNVAPISKRFATSRR